MEENNIVEWQPQDMLEVVLNEPDDFLKVRETLTRIGVASRKDKKLFQSCHLYISINECRQSNYRSIGRIFAMWHCKQPSLNV